MTAAVTVSDWKARHQGTLRGFFTVHLPSGLTLHEAMLHTRDGSWWVAPASKPMIGKDGTASRDADGKIRYAPIVSFRVQGRAGSLQPGGARCTAAGASAGVRRCGGHAMSDCAITVMHARGRRLTKLIHADGSTTGYDDARTFDALEIVVRDLDHLAAILLTLLPCWDRCIVRGSLIGGSPAVGIRRLLHPDPKTDDQPTLYEVPRRYVAIDVDGDAIHRPPEIPATDIAGCARIAITHLPPEFHGRACIAVATGSHGLKPGIRLRLWYWLAGAATRPVLQAWFMDRPGIDMATFRPVQPCYTAAPVLADGVADPVPDRLVALPGEPNVRIRPLPVMPPRAARATAQAGQRRQPTGGNGAEQPGGSRTIERRSPSPPSGSKRGDAYRDRALIGIKDELLRATENQRHNTLIAAATRMFELGSLSDAYVDRVIREAATVLNGRGTRQIDAEEVDELLDWARSRASSGRAAA